MIKKKDFWIAYSQQTKKQLFFYQDKVYDLTNFMNQHPGGRKALANYVNKDITEILFTVYPHKKDTTLARLSSFVIGKIPENEAKQSNKVQRQVTPTKQKKKVCFAKKEQEKTSKTEVVKQKEQKQAKSKKKKERSKSKNKDKTKTKTKSNKMIPSIVLDQNFVIPRATTHEIDPIDDDTNQEKPQFKVPILSVKHMNDIK